MTNFNSFSRRQYIFRGCLSEDDYFAYNPTNMQIDEIHRALLLSKWNFAFSFEETALEVQIWLCPFMCPFGKPSKKIYKSYKLKGISQNLDNGSENSEKASDHQLGIG